MLRHAAILLLVAVIQGQAQLTATADGDMHPGLTWSSSDEEAQKLRARCWSESNAVSRARVPDVMAELGASPEAVAFARARNDGSYLRYVDTTGIVRVAILHYPLRVHDTHDMLLLLPQKEEINVDESISLENRSLLNDQQWASLADEYPDLALQPADRSPRFLPEREQLRAGRFRLIIQYRLTNGCRACAQVGYARDAWYFEADGRFLGRKLLAIFRQPEERPEGQPADCPQR